MEIRLHNTQSGAKERFEPLSPQQVGVYVCGPTVYGLCNRRETICRSSAGCHRKSSTPIEAGRWFKDVAAGPFGASYRADRLAQAIR